MPLWEHCILAFCNRVVKGALRCTYLKPKLFLERSFLVTCTSKKYSPQSLSIGWSPYNTMFSMYLVSSCPPRCHCSCEKTDICQFIYVLISVVHLIEQPQMGFSKTWGENGLRVRRIQEGCQWGGANILMDGRSKSCLMGERSYLKLKQHPPLPRADGNLGNMA